MPLVVTFHLKLFYLYAPFSPLILYNIPPIYFPLYNYKRILKILKAVQSFTYSNASSICKVILVQSHRMRH